MAFNELDAVLIIALYAAIFWERSKLTKDEIAEIYEKKRNRLCGNPPPQLFGIMWTILYVCKLLSGYFFLYSEALPMTYSFYIGSFILYFLDIVLNKEWTVFFFDNKWPLVALITAIMMAIINIIYAAFMAVNSNWWAFGWILPYVVWIIIACIWNGQWLRGDEEKRVVIQTTNFQMKATPNIPRSPMKIPPAKKGR